MGHGYALPSGHDPEHGSDGRVARYYSLSLVRSAPCHGFWMPLSAQLHWVYAGTRAGTQYNSLPGETDRHLMRINERFQLHGTQAKSPPHAQLVLLSAFSTITRRQSAMLGIHDGRPHRFPVTRNCGLNPLRPVARRAGELQHRPQPPSIHVQIPVCPHGGKPRRCASCMSLCEYVVNRPTHFPPTQTGAHRAILASGPWWAFSLASRAFPQQDSHSSLPRRLGLVPSSSWLVLSFSSVF